MLLLAGRQRGRDGERTERRYELGGVESVAALRRAASSGDSKSLYRIAHTLKGQSGSVGARRVEIVSRHLEERARRGEIEEADQLIAQLESELSRARQALADLGVDQAAATVKIG